MELLNVSKAMDLQRDTKVKTKLDTSVALAYVSCLTVSLAVIHLVSEYEFSSVLTLSVFFQALALALVLLQIESTGNVCAVSGKSMSLFAVTSVLRLSSTLFFDGYLPLDRTGDFIHQGADLVSLLMVLKILHSCYCTHRLSLRADEDTANVKDIFMVCVALSILVHPQMNDWATFDIAWAASLYVDTVAMVPQLMMISKTKRLPAYTGHYMFATFVSRGFSTWFWIYAFDNMLYLDGGFSLAALAIVVAHVAQFLVLAGFGYYYLKHCAKAGSGIRMS